MLAASLAASAPAGAEGQEAWGGEPLATDRPDFTEGASAVAPGRLQLESGYTFERSGETETHTLGELLLRIGLAHRLEARIGVNSFAVVETPDGETRGFEDLSLGGKLELRAARGPLSPALALLASTTLPTGADGIGTDAVEPGVVLTASVDLPERLALGANLGYRNRSSEGGRVDEPYGSVALGIDLTSRLGVFVETFALLPAGEEDAAFVDAGITWRLGPDAQLDARVGAGLAEPDPSYFLGAGFSFRR